MSLHRFGYRDIITVGIQGQRPSLQRRTTRVRRSGRSLGMHRIVLVLSMLLALLSTVDLRAQRTLPNDADSETAGQGKGDDSLMMVLPYEYIEVKSSASYSDATITSNIDDTLSGLVRQGTTSPTWCADRALKSARIDIRLDLGEIYEFGNTTTFSALCTLKIVGRDGTGSVIFEYGDIPMSIDKDHPEQIYRKVIPEAFLTTYDQATTIDLYVQGYTSPGSPWAADLRLLFEYHEDHRVGVIDLGSPGSSLLTMRGAPGITIDNPFQFKWRVIPGCYEVFPNTQFQLLRLYNIDTSYTEETETRAVVDWSQALTIETGGPSRTST